MPGGDGTGPMGMGSMTGCGAGFCAGVPYAGYANSYVAPCGFGGRRGFRRMYYATNLPGWARFGYPQNVGATEPINDEREFLSRQADYLENQLKQVKNRISDLEENAE